MGLVAWGAYRVWPRTIEIHPAPLIPECKWVDGRNVVTLPGRYLVAQIGEYDDEFYAYLMYQYFSGARPFRNGEVLLTYRRGVGLLYPVEVQLDNDVTASYTLLAEAQASGLIKHFEWRFVTENRLLDFRHQRQVFVTAYSLTTHRRIEDLSRSQLLAYLRRFVQFKSSVDPRIRGKIDPVPLPLTQSQAQTLAVDILAVTDFYELPVEFFLGIGAMENNYMNVKGDLEHAVWKRRAQRGDIVLKRKGGRVLVLNPASGIWQITRETLRYSHQLYLRDKRDYSKLPERLRPPKELDLDNPDSEVLTTYAGLLFRDLLDRFQGDVATAVGAYNGGPGNPNPRYEEGVRMVAEYARTVMQQAATLNGQPAAGMRFLTPGR